MTHSDSEWHSSQGSQDDEDGLAPPDFEKFWGIEDAHGHRYMAQLSDGKDRWLLPLPRADFEQMWAALCTQNPDWADKFGSTQNFLRQYIGQLMNYMIENGDWAADPYVEALALEKEIQKWEVKAERIRSTIRHIADDTLPDDIRLRAIEILLLMDESEVVSVNEDCTFVRLHEWAHMLELGS